MKSRSIDFEKARGGFSVENILLTGATGVFGAHLMKELLASTTANLYCLVRGESFQAAKERLLSFLHVYDPENFYGADFIRRVIPIFGDVVQPNLGLSSQTYRELAEKVDVVIHSAAFTNLFAPYRTVESINVGGTKNIILFCLQTHQKYLCYVSTHTVMGDKIFDREFVFKECDTDVGQRFEYMTYQKSKFLAEGLVRQYGNEGLRWNIIRPGQIFGESRTGCYPRGQTNVSGLFYDIFKTVIETERAFHSRIHFDITPVDYLSKATVQLALKEKSFGETYHITNPHVRTYTETVNVIRELGYPIQIVTQDEYKKLLFEKGLQRNGSEYKSFTTKAFKWWYQKKAFDFSQSARTDCTYTYNILSPYGITCPKADIHLLGTYIESGIRENYFPKPPAPARATRSIWTSLSSVSSPIALGQIE